jgi:hypothetical protein
MSSAAAVDALIGELAAGLQPVKRLASPWRRAALWLCASLWIGGLLALFTPWNEFAQRMMGAPDMWLGFAGGLLTAVLAAVAAFLTSVPGRSAWWGALPLPALALWVSASTAGCLRRTPVAHTQPEPMMHPMLCIYFIVLVAVPLAMLLMWQLMRACPLRPGLTAALGGLASAGAAATLLAFVHPFDATFEDLGAHAVAVVLVVAAAKMLGESRLTQAGRKRFFLKKEAKTFAN